MWHAAPVKINVKILMDFTHANAMKFQGKYHEKFIGISCI